MWMQTRRFTRLTNAFSKKAENHAHAVSLYFMYYHFCRPHTTLTKAKKGVHHTPVMSAGVTDHVWTVEEIGGLMDPHVKIKAPLWGLMLPICVLRVIVLRWRAGVIFLTCRVNHTRANYDPPPSSLCGHGGFFSTRSC